VNESPARSRKRPPAADDTPIDQLVYSHSREELIAAGSDHRLTEELALNLLNRRDLPAEALEQLGKNSAVAKHRKVQTAIVMHPRTPRHISIPTIRHLYTFELMQIALFPAVAADVKRAAEEVLIGRLESISAGERHTLAKQASGRVAAALLLDQEERIMQAALANSRMTEALVARALRMEVGTELLAPAVCRHQKWSCRNEIRMALLGNENTPFARVLQFANELPVRVLKDVLRTSRLSANVKKYLQTVVEQRK
jgi:hypothetical protein